MSEADSPRVTILLSTFNGAAFLPEQLASFLEQTHRHWVLLWRDDGSTDGSVAIVEQFSQTGGAGRCLRLAAPAQPLGACESFLTLLRAALPGLGPRDAIAFADQDDVWLPEKLARGVAALAALSPERPALLCARQILVDAGLRRRGESPRLSRPPGFPAALTQNIATGCTIVLNGAAAALVAGSRAPGGTLHDWWCYLVVAGAGGVVQMDDTPLVLYRQHGGNAVGAPRSMLGRAVGAWRRGPAAFMRLLRAHLDALADQPGLLTEAARRDVACLRAGLGQGTLHRLAALRLPGLRRQTALETLVFRLWFLLG